MSKQKLFLFYTLVVLLLVTSIFPQSPKRSDIPDRYKWNLSDMYPNLADWQADLKNVESSINDFTSFKGN